MRSRSAAPAPASVVDASVEVGAITLPAPIMTASGTGGHATELSVGMDLSALGAVVVKSLSAEPWAGNPAPRLLPTVGGMINSVGLQGPGIAAWRRDALPELEASGARVVVSIWGRTVAEYAAAAEALADAPASIVAVEVNVSCPNLEDRSRVFAHDPATTAAVIEATAPVGRPRWAKLSPNVTDLVPIAAAAREAGADAVTLINTMMGMVIDVETRRPALGGGGGGLSGPAIHPIAVRAVYDCFQAIPDLPIVGVGGVATARDAVELLLAGAVAVQVGTASFADPSVPRRIQDGVIEWCAAHSVARVQDLTGGAHVH